jgi:hypothetical protein
VPDIIANAIFDVKESVFVERESELNSAEPEALCCDGGATSSLSFSFLNCSEVTERVGPIQTAQASRWYCNAYNTWLSQDVLC